MVQKYREFREKFETFIYNGYTIEESEDKIDVVYDFSVPGLSDFAPTWSFPKKINKMYGEINRFIIENPVKNKRKDWYNDYIRYD